jgi:hypothetical protein
MTDGRRFMHSWDLKVALRRQQLPLSRLPTSALPRIADDKIGTAPTIWRTGHLDEGGSYIAIIKVVVSHTFDKTGRHP